MEYKRVASKVAGENDQNKERDETLKYKAKGQKRMLIAV